MSDAAHRPPLIIAEAGVNHNGDLAMALDLVDAAAEAGADMVKFQAFTADTLTSAAAPSARYQSQRTGHSEQIGMLRALELSVDAFAQVAERCDARGIEFLCTPFDPEMLAPLTALGMKRIKIASGELTNGPALAKFGAAGLPILLSTGMATLDETRDAVETLRRAGAGEITLLHCTSLYPAPMETLNLAAMTTMRESLGLPVGYSDHSTGIHASIAATALGATVLEKHYTLDRDLPGPDHAASLEPGELADMIRQVRDVAAALGDGVKRPHADEAETALVARRSWHAARDLDAGTVLSDGDVIPLRPETGIPANRPVTGSALTKSVAAGSPILPEDLAV